MFWPMHYDGLLHEGVEMVRDVDAHQPLPAWRFWRSTLPSQWWRSGWTWIAMLVAIACLLRVAAMVFVPLIPEEAYYWMYAQHPAMSYFDHPPMVAWVIWLG